MNRTRRRTRSPVHVVSFPNVPLSITLNIFLPELKIIWENTNYVNILNEFDLSKHVHQGVGGAVK